MLQCFGFDAVEIDALFDIVAAILHIGDVSFKSAANVRASDYPTS